MSANPPSSRPRHRRRWFGTLLLTAAIGLLYASGGFASADEIEELRGGIPTGEAVGEALVGLTNERDALLTSLNAAEVELTAELDSRAGLDEEQQLLAARIEEAIDHLRTVAVRSFVAGGELGELQFLVNVTSVSDLSWRRHLLRNHADSTHQALEQLRALEAQASDEVRASVEEAERLRTEIASAEADLASLEQLLAQTRAIQPLADAWDRAAIAIEEGRYGIAPADKWAKLRSCESTDNYRAISSTGAYRGAYQFDLATWRTVGGAGDPAAAPPAEQDARARELYARRGDAPWPECGHHLR